MKDPAPMILRQLIAAIKKKKELRHLDNSFIGGQIEAYFRHHPHLQRSLSRPKSENYKKIIKGIRASLRRSAGLFHGSTIQTHPSTRERLPLYRQLYQKIWEITGKPESILDLGCGLNPLSFQFMGLDDVTYHAYDVDEQIAAVINKFFRTKKIGGMASVRDVTTASDFPPTDICFLFKMTDILEKGKGHKATEAMITKIPAKFIVVSFPTVTMSGKPMNFPRRRWIELMCARLGHTFTVLQFSREIFYVVEKYAGQYHKVQNKR